MKWIEELVEKYGLISGSDPVSAVNQNLAYIIEKLSGRKIFLTENTGFTRLTGMNAREIEKLLPKELLDELERAYEAFYVFSDHVDKVISIIRRME